MQGDIGENVVEEPKEARHPVEEESHKAGAVYSELESPEKVAFSQCEQDEKDYVDNEGHLVDEVNEMWWLTPTPW